MMIQQTGPNDTAENPDYTDAENGDFSVPAGGGLIGTGLSISLGVKKKKK